MAPRTGYQLVGHAIERSGFITQTKKALPGSIGLGESRWQRRPRWARNSECGHRRFQNDIEPTKPIPGLKTGALGHKDDWPPLRVPFIPRLKSLGFSGKDINKKAVFIGYSSLV